MLTLKIQVLSLCSWSIHWIPFGLQIAALGFSSWDNGGSGNNLQPSADILYSRRYHLCPWVNSGMGIHGRRPCSLFLHVQKFVFLSGESGGSQIAMDAFRVSCQHVRLVPHSFLNNAQMGVWCCWPIEFELCCFVHVWFWEQTFVLWPSWPWICSVLPLRAKMTCVCLHTRLSLSL